jgi:uncharacterized RDD family membrane protein YckC
LFNRLPVGFILCRITVLFSLTIQAQGRLSNVLTPVNGQIIGFLTLTVPVFLYFFLSEAGSKRASIGKRINKIRVYLFNESGITTIQIFYRNIFKLLPWEIAHTGVHWLMYYLRSSRETPAWVYLLLIIPQIIVLVYLTSIIVQKEKAVSTIE